MEITQWQLKQHFNSVKKCCAFLERHTAYSIFISEEQEGEGIETIVLSPEGRTVDSTIHEKEKHPVQVLEHITGAIWMDRIQTRLSIQ